MLILNLMTVVHLRMLGQAVHSHMHALWVHKHLGTQETSCHKSKETEVLDSAFTTQQPTELFNKCIYTRFKRQQDLRLMNHRTVIQAAVLSTKERRLGQSQSRGVVRLSWHPRRDGRSGGVWTGRQVSSVPFSVHTDQLGNPGKDVCCRSVA